MKKPSLKKEYIYLGVFGVGILGSIVSRVWDYIVRTEFSIGNYQIAGIAGGVIIAVLGAALFAKVKFLEKKKAEVKEEISKE